MRYIFTLFFFLSLFIFLMCQRTNAQSVAINNDGSAANGSAMLDVKSSTKGILIPRMDSNSRKAISSPADGLMVYDTDTKSIWAYQGGTSLQWKELQLVNKNSFLVYRSTDVVYSAGSTSIPFDTENFDDGDIYNPTFSRFFAPETGVYHFDAGITAVNAGAFFQVSVYKYIGGSSSRLSTTIVRPSSTGFPVTTNISYTFKLNKNEGIAIWMEPGVGSVTVKGGTDQSWFSGYRIY
jgi:hypothetical protein